ncbi:MAG: endo-1,4-beta-xylanase [Bacteroides sp.]|nr:endo-1,4-beta-xylanase [Bacteroides sp.]
MKYTNKFLGALCLAAFGFASCADDYSLLDYDVEKPASIEAYEYLNDYKPLKEYDNSANPDFKLGAGITVSDYNAGGMVYRLATSNFDEVTAGNAMKYASVVDDKGSMSFDAVASFVSQAKAGGQTIYGHTLAWHAQQNNKYLNSLLKDKEIEIDPDAVVVVEDKQVNYADFTSFPFYNMGYAPDFDGEKMIISNDTPTGANWEKQYFIADGISTKPGSKYTVTIKIKGSTNGTIDIVMGNWGATSTQPMEFTTEWQELSVDFNAITTESCFVLGQSGLFIGTIEMEWLKVTHEEAAAVTYYEDLVSNGDAEGKEVVNFISTHIGATNGPATIVDGAGVNGSRAFVVESAGGGVNSWDTQFFIKTNIALKADDKVKVSFDYRADVANNSESQAHGAPGAYIHWDGGVAVSFTTEWQHFEKIVAINSSMSPSENMQSWAWNLDVGAPSAPVNKYYFDNITVAIERSGNTIPLTPEEKKDTLVWAMNNWISGMMTATEGYVSAWDVVNEPISGQDVDGDGYYDLWSSENSAGDNNFYWTDYLGNLDYVRTAVKQAREHYIGEAPLKLFINDYNLESDWDDNKKLKSLINWIEKWEEDDVTKIDGIGTQMHISYYENAATQASKEAAIENMFELMAATGKLVKISELDMGYVDANGNSVKTVNMTEEQHFAMAEYYKFIIKKYFEIIPAAQQYGITQWCVTDSPAGSGWRAEEPVGLWDANYNRKHVYAGFADGLAGE